MTPTAPLTDRNLGWLRYLYRKATTDDSWDREDRPHEHWDNQSDPPMLCWHRFDLIDSTYAVALMADRTPAWREVYQRVLDELIYRHTGWWAAEDWLTQIGHDPERANYPDAYRMLIPASQWGNYDVPGWTANGIEPWGLQWDPIGADGNLFFKGFFLLMLGLHRRTTGDARWDSPFEIIRDGEHTFTWWHTRIAEHLAEQWRGRPEGCHCENTKIWPYCLAGAGLGLQLADLAFGTNHHEVFRTWWQHARSEYLHLDGDALPNAVTLYYDPIIEEHLNVPTLFGAVPAFYLAPQVPEEARRLWDGARAQAGILDVDGPVAPLGPRMTGTTLFLAREWGEDALADALQAAADERYQPTWDTARGEFTWGFELDEPHPRGQYNGTMAAAEVMTRGAWWRLANEASDERFDQPEVLDVDFPKVALSEARWEDDSLLLRLHPMNVAVVGEPTSFRIAGVADVDGWRVSGADASCAADGPDLRITTTISAASLTLHR